MLNEKEKSIMEKVKLKFNKKNNRDFDSAIEKVNKEIQIKLALFEFCKQLKNKLKVESGELKEILIKQISEM